MTFTPHPNKKTARLIDANLDRAKEGLRVIEDWCRFGMNRKDLILKLKNWRHQLSLHHHESYKQARSSSTDEGALLDHPAQQNRQSPNDIVYANCARVQEALRVLEEFSRNTDPSLAKDAASIRFEIYEFETTFLQANQKKNRLEILNNSNICLITAPQNELIKTVSAALNAGIKMVQYRCKGHPDRIKLEEAQELSSICKKNDALLIINDRVDIAIALDADGVHLGQDDMPTEVARKILGEERLIGKSTHTINQIKAAQNESCDYIGIGPIFPSKSKPTSKALGVEFLSEASNQIRLPCFAIGGINISNIMEVKSNGIKRIAVINAIINSKDPFLASNKLLNQLL